MLVAERQRETGAFMVGSSAGRLRITGRIRRDAEPERVLTGTG
jgi:hypothetical protein